MNSPRFRRVCLLALLLPVAAPAFAHDPARDMALAGQRFLDALDAEQRKEVVFEASAEERQNWHFVPDKFIQPGNRRYGLPLAKMNPAQVARAHALLNTALSHRGFVTAMTITSLEQILHELENGNPIRDPELYYVTIFGTPGDEDAWGWRFEGHHLSINVTVVDGKLFSVTPSFFGSNPGIVKSGPQEGLWTLEDEEQLARQLVKSLNDEQRKTAILSEEAPADIITREERKAEQGKFTPAEGIAWDDLDDEQQQLALQIVKTYAEKYRPEIVDQIHARTKLFDLSKTYFAWAGGMEQGDGHYYRIQTPKFLFEYDNTQNDANHVHAVWRDFDGDFGADLLREHYEKHHAAND